MFKKIVIDTVKALKGEWPEFTNASAFSYHSVLEYHFLGCAKAYVRLKDGDDHVMLDEFNECVNEYMTNFGTCERLDGLFYSKGDFFNAPRN
jgi:NurA-like 5'-3' nuclease